MSQATPIEENPDLESCGTSPEDYDGPRCEKCGAPSDASACSVCGWYPSLGIYVEIDQQYESYLREAPAEADSVAEQSAAAAAAQPDWQKHLAVWQNLIPVWGWALLGTAGGVFALAIAARVVTLTSPTLQTYCGVGGLLGGVAVTVIVHLVAFVLRSSQDATLGVFDVLVKPAKVWKPLLGELPRRFWLTNTANAGLSAAVGAALIVGGIPYEHLLDWGFKAKPKPSLMAMVAQQAAAMPDNGSDDLEGAVSDFAGKAAGDLEAAGPPAPKPRLPLECLVIGYQTNNQDGLQTLLLAADAGGQLKYVGKVRPDLDAKQADALLTKLSKHPSPRPFVRTSESATWVKPKFACKATYTEWPQGKRPRGLAWEALLDELAW